MRAPGSSRIATWDAIMTKVATAMTPYADGYEPPIFGEALAIFYLAGAGQCLTLTDQMAARAEASPDRINAADQRFRLHREFRRQPPLARHRAGGAQSSMASRIKASASR